jgi:hypothetical protein
MNARDTAVKAVEYCEKHITEGRSIMLQFPSYCRWTPRKISPKLWNSWKDSDGRGYLVVGSDGLYMRRGKRLDFLPEYKVNAILGYK